MPQQNTTRRRASAIVLKNDCLLLIHRRKNGSEYYVLPGGGIENNEKEIEAVLRELEEETGLKGNNPNIAFYEISEKTTNPFFFVNVRTTNLKLGGPEKLQNTIENWYNPEWKNLSEIKDLNILPTQTKTKLIELLL